MYALSMFLMKSKLFSAFKIQRQKMEKHVCASFLPKFTISKTTIFFYSSKCINPNLLLKKTQLNFEL